MLAVMVTVGSAFTAEKDAPFADTFLQRATPTGTWAPGSSVTCSGSAAACKIKFPETVEEDHFQTIGNAAPASGTTYQVSGIDHDNNPSTATITVNVTILSRFAN